ncbi:hypothetical protein [Psittacicella hinzii]|uniref:hypothetical protein n=1 Tax=Psittacicella hinzii TaxID=2028575 RepID=UPI000E681E05|nr:hypothetical protein [Psittacicella hinzii]
MWWKSEQVHVNFNQAERTSVDFFNQICLFLGFRSKNFKLLFSYCQNKGWVSEPTIFVEEFKALVNAWEEVPDYEEGKEITLEQALYEDLAENYITALFLEPEYIPLHSLEELYIGDDKFSPVLVEGDIVAVLRKDKFCGNGLYLIRKVDAVQENPVLVELAEQAESKNFKVLYATNPELNNSTLNRDDFEIIYCIAVATRRGAPVVLPSQMPELNNN